MEDSGGGGGGKARNCGINGLIFLLLSQPRIIVRNAILSCGLYARRVVRRAESEGPHDNNRFNGVKLAMVAGGWWVENRGRPTPPPSPLPPPP